MQYLQWLNNEVCPENNLTLPLHADSVTASLEELVKELINLKLTQELKQREENIDRIEEEILEQQTHAEDPDYSPSSGDAESDKEASDTSQPSSQKTPKPVVQKKSTLKRKAPVSVKGKPPPPKRARTATSSLTATAVPPSSTFQPVQTPGSEKRSHHKKRSCPVCGKQETNLKRHLESHAKKGLVDYQNIDAIVSICDRQDHYRGAERKTTERTLAGLPLKWCPIEDCQIVTHLLRSHLSRKHHLKSGTLLDKHVQLAKPYKGLLEVDKLKHWVETGKAASARMTSTSSP